MPNEESTVRLPARKSLSVHGIRGKWALTLPFLPVLVAALVFGAAQLRAQGVFIRADCDASGRVDITDPINGLTYLFSGGREPVCLDACDSDDSGRLDISDAINTLSFLFLGTHDPPPPFPLEEADPTGDDLTCANGRNPPAELRLLPAELILYRVGNRYTLSLLATDPSGSVEDVRASPFVQYLVSGDAAQVSPDGIVTALEVGTASVHARYRGVVRDAIVRVLPGADGAPVVRITSPRDGSLIASPRVIVSGRVTDPAAALTLGGAPLDNQGGFFSRTVDLTDGANVLEVTAVGAAGTGNAAVNVTRALPGSPAAAGPDGVPLPQTPEPAVSPADATAPRVTITSPRNGAVLFSRSVEVAGTVDDASAGVWAAGVPAAIDATGAFHARALLNAGSNTLLVEAFDAVGNRGTASVIVTVDVQAPRVAITEPAGVVAGSPSGDTLVTVRGTVDPPDSPVTIIGAAAQVAGASWSAPLALHPGPNVLIATASLPGQVSRRSQDVREVTVDTEGPVVELLYPPEAALLTAQGFRVEGGTVRFVGRIRDSGVAGDLEGPLSVALGATAAELVNGSFQVDATLATGFNTLRLIAADARGKTTVRDYKVVRGGSAGPTLSAISGDAAAVTAGQPGSVQLIVEARDAAGAVEKSVPVEFRVALGDGRLDGGARSRTLLTAASGRAAVLFTPGTQAGAALVLATAPDRVNSPAGFSASVSPSASRILVAHGKRQLAGIAGLDAATSPSVRLLDEFGNPVLGESVTFRVVDGGARFSGSVQVQAVTGLQGVAAAALRLPASIESRSVVEVSHAAAPATVVFEALGGALGPPADTSVAGSVLDERGIPVAGAIVKLRTGAGDLSTTADSVGGFEIPGAPGGAAVLFPEEPAHEGISSRTFLIPGRRNLLDAPLRLMRTASDLRHRSELVGESQGALLTLPSLPGLRCSVAPGAARFPDGTRSGRITIAALGWSSLPSPFPDDLLAEVPVVLLPEGVRFDPPAALCLPAARDRSGRTVPLFAHRSAAGGFVELPGGIVDDAEIVSTTSSHGVRSSGVHFFSQAGPPAGRVGSLFGEVSAPIPGLSDAPQRPESLVLGINVYAHSGELFVDEVDLELPSPGRGMPYRFRRRYESRHNFQGALGRNWEHDYEDRRVAPAPDGGNVLRADGAGGFVEYLLDASTGAWVSPPGVFARLTSAADGSIVEREPDGTSYHYHALDAGPLAGRLEAVADRTGARLRFIHGAEGRLLQAVDAVGRFVAYEHDGAGRITRVTDFTGRVVSFEYDGAGDLVAVTRPAVVLSPPGNDFPDGKRREYVYSAGFTDVRLLHNLVQIIDPREVAGARAPRLTVEYGTDPLQPSFDRVTGEVWGGTNATGIPAGGNLHFEYSTWTRPPAASAGALELEAYLVGSAGRTRFTDADGRLREIIWNGAGLPLSSRIFTGDDGPWPQDPARLHPPAGTIPPYYETRWTWTREGLLAAQVEPRGGRTLYFYDEAAPVRHAQAALVRREVYPAPLASGGASKPAVTTWVREPLFGVVVEEVPPAGNDSDPPDAARWRTRRILDYQEGADPAVLAEDTGIPQASLIEALARAGVSLGLGDVNGDGDTSQRFGNVVRETPPPATPPDGGASIGGSTTRRYNRFGQLTACIDEEGRVERFSYHPESDFNGDGVPDPGEGADGFTGGLLAQCIRDLGTPSGPREVVIDTWSYDAVGFLARHVDGNANEELFVFNALGQLTEHRLAAPLKYRTHYLYDLDDNLVRVRVENYTQTDGGGHFLVSENRWLDADCERDLLGQAVTVIREVSEGEVGPARSITTAYRYSPMGRLVRAIPTTPGSEEAYAYDARGLLVERRLAAGTADESRTVYFYDEDGQLSIADGHLARGREEQRYDGFGRLAAVVDAAGGSRVFERDIEGRVRDEWFLGAPGGPTPPGSGDAGKVLLLRTGRSYDERGRKIEERRLRFESGAAPGSPAETLVERWFYDAAGLLTRHVSPEGLVTDLAYDAAGRLMEARDSGGRKKTYTRDDVSNVVKEVREHLTLDPVDPRAPEDPEYGPEGRYREVEIVLRAFDGLGRIILLCEPGGGVWRARYDSRNNLIYVADAKGSSLIETEPELAAILPLMPERQRANLNAPGNRRRYRYDNLGRLVEARHELHADGEGTGTLDTTSPYDRDGIITETFEWDDAGRLTAWTDDVGNRTRLERDGAGFIRRKVWPDASSETHERSRDGRLTRLTDANGSVCTQEFDALGRLTRRSIVRAEGLLGTTLQVFEHDGLSRLTLACDDNDPDDSADDSFVRRSWDSLGGLVEESQDGYEFGARRDAGGALVALRYPDGAVVETPRDARGRVISLSDGSGLRARYRFFGSDRPLDQRFWNGVELSFLRDDGTGVLRNLAYDAFGEPVEYAYQSPSPGFVHTFQYGRDRCGYKLYELLLHRPDGLGEAWRYDSVYRIQKFLPNVFDPRVPPIDPIEKLVFYSDGNHSWRLIEVNFSVRKLEVNAREAFIRSDDDELTYDARGSLRAAGDLSFTYDALARLVQASRGGRSAGRYRYDAVGADDPEEFAGKGRRVSKDVRLPVTGQPAGLIRFTYAGQRLAEERSSDTAVLRRYLYADADSPEVLVTESEDGGTRRSFAVLHDAAGSVTGLAGADGSVVETIRYDPLGKPQIRNALNAPVAFSGLESCVGFGGLYHDFELGLIATGGRPYDPTFGRYVTDGGPQMPAAPLELNGYLYPGLPGLPGEIAGRPSKLRRADYLETFRPQMGSGRPGRDPFGVPLPTIGDERPTGGEQP